MSIHADRLLGAALAAGVLLYSAGLVWLHDIDLKAPPHDEVVLEGGVPATLSLPFGELGPFAVQASGARERPPAVVLLHGYTGDRIVMGHLARALTRAGYAVLSIDLRGHGRNRTPLSEGIGRPDHFDPDIAAAVRFLRGSLYVDGSRIALVGHSMGARAALAYTSLGSHADAVVLIAGGWVLSGPHRPLNLLFIHAERDLPSVPVAAGRIVAQLAAVRAAEPGRTYGDFADGTAVARVEVAGTSHASIIRSDAAFDEIRGWLDRAFGRVREAKVESSRRASRAALMALVGFLLVLPVVGSVVARLAPAARTAPMRDSTVRDLLLLGGALLVPLPVFYARFPGVLLSASDADRGVTYFALAGLLLLAVVGLRGEGRGAGGGGWRAGVLIGVGPVVLAYLLLNPIAVGVRGIGLTPERAGIAVAAAAFLFPFTFSCHVLLRGGGPTRRTAFALAGRALTLVAIEVAVALGAFAPGERVLGRVLLPAYGMLELMFAAYYARGGGVITAAVLECLWVGWFLAVVFPVNV